MTFWLLLLLLLRCSTSSKRIKPRNLLVATLLDLENPDAAILLLRSYRALGSTLNNATLLACIPAAAKGGTILTDVAQNLQALALGLTLELAFVHVERKSITKFESLKHFNAARFDYLLWLDPNAVILRDPLPLLATHPFPGVVKCAPELYAYTDHTSGFPRQIDSDGTSYCNTGVLLFDSEAVRRFLDVLPSVDALNFSSFSGPFLPSLYFSAAAARAGLTVAPLPRAYSLNMMVSFEAEILASTGLSYSKMPHILRFTDDTSLRCFQHGPPPPPPPAAAASDGGGCSCHLQSIRGPPNSVVMASLQSLLNRHGGDAFGLSGDAICRLFAGAQGPPNPVLSAASSFSSAGIIDHVDLVVEKSLGPGPGPGLRCRLLQPPHNGSVVHVADALSPVEVSFDLCCHSPQPLSSWAATAAAAAAASASSPASARGGAAVEITARVLISLPSQSGPLLSATSLVPVRPAGPDLSWCFSWTTVVSRDASDVRPDGTYQLEASVSLDLDLAEVEEAGGETRRRTVQTLEGEGPAIVTVAVGAASLHPSFSSVAAQPQQQQHHQRLPPLAHQRKLYELIGLSLNLGLDQSQRSNAANSSKTVRGVIVCCDTERGLLTAQSLLTHTQPSTWPWPGAESELVIILSALPPAPAFSDDKKASMERVGKHFGSLCSGARQRCVIIAQLTTEGASSALASTFPRGSLSFVYIDVFHGFSDHLAALKCWWAALASHGGGILAGSRFGSPGPASREGLVAAGAGPRGASRVEARHGVRLAVDAFSQERGVGPPSITYLDAVCDQDEGAITHVNSNKSIDECLPGFYFAKSQKI